ncbi:nucleotidyltransferase family protein [Janthinobacterium sp. PC23-8]|uniref:nucleotidyltransferase family protein n=1 Tax=Janthinobacterium sp. PC23-8 TaxID=2012679 RepID=UPI000B962157|nr:nucleotidyltransferase family protein [Janthinobacterium sp. PC23-8]OYO31199.1 alcohol dehydrogenase [Janthinobacterium sp. PC23-8]
MKNWEKTLISPETTLHHALEVIEQVGCQIALIVDSERRLLGTLSDGDVRRGLLKGLVLSDSVTTAMYPTPRCARDDEDRQSVLARMRQLGVHQIPLVNQDGIVTGLNILDDYLSVPLRENWVVIMAGGLGSRLAELTRNTPKPMLKVGSRPLLETIVRNYAEQGFRRFYIAVNFKAEQILDHFGDGSSFGVEIQYLHENQRLGTAGALSLLPERPTLPFIVTNADLLTKENYGHMLDRHLETEADATMAVRNFEMRVPFGVVRSNNGQIEGIEEKPLQQFIVSAGTCILSPHVLDLVPSGEFYDMPTLFETLIDKRFSTRSHVVNGYWLDIGHLPDYERANSDFFEVFQ